MSKPSNSKTPEGVYAMTAARLAAIQAHLDTKPRTGRLSGKVAILTGCGSINGIGCVSSDRAVLASGNGRHIIRLLRILADLPERRYML